MNNLNELDGYKYDELVKITEGSRDSIKSVFDLIFRVGFLKPDEKMIDDKISKAHEALEEYRKLLKESLKF